MTKQLVWFGAAVMATLLALLALWQFRIVVIYVLLSLALAAAVRPLVQRWVRRGLVMRLVLILIFLVALVSFGFLLFLGSVSATGEIQQLAQRVAVEDEWRLAEGLKGSSFEQVLATRLPSPGDLFKEFTGDQGQLVLPALLGFSQGIATIVSGGFVVLLLSLYWSMNQIHFERLWLSLLPAGQRKQARDIWRTVEPDIGAYIRSEVVQSLLAGLLLSLGYWALGSPYPVLLALAGALVCLIPLVGPALALIPPLLVGLLTSGQLSLLTALYTLAVLIALEGWVKPRLFNHRQYNPILTIVILMALADALGLIGIIVAPPLSAVCQILWRHLVSHRAVSGSAAQISDLKERQAGVWAAIKAMDEPLMPLVTSSMERLTDLIEKAEPVLQVALPAEPSGPFPSPQPVIAEGGRPNIPKRGRTP
jgi:predicted PurR-regulated permease PerM